MPMEPKLCEFCGRQFFREIPEDARSGTKYCCVCVRALEDKAKSDAEFYALALRECQPTLKRGRT